MEIVGRVRISSCCGCPVSTTVPFLFPQRAVSPFSGPSSLCQMLFSTGHPGGGGGKESLQNTLWGMLAQRIRWHDHVFISHTFLGPESRKWSLQLHRHMGSRNQHYPHIRQLRSHSELLSAILKL